MRPQADEIARQNDRCDLCGNKVLRKNLVRTNVRYERPAGSNYFLYSRYDSTDWDLTNLVATGSYDCFGPQDHNNRVRIGDGAAYGSYEDTTEIGGAPSFEITSPGKVFTKAGFDASTWTSLVVGGYFGIYHDNRVGSAYDDDVENIAVTVAIGVGATSGATTQTLRTVTNVRSGQHIWAKLDISDLDSSISSDDVYFWATITLDSTPTGTYKVWFDWLQVEKNATRPGAYISTSGAAIDYATPKKLMTVIKVCPKHRERLTLESEQWGRPRRETELPVPSDIQEV
jgi:hypothetical protein